MEKWKYIEETNRFYSISDKGRVRSHQFSFDKILKPYVRDRHGSLSVDLRISGKRKTKRIQRLVLEAFIGPCPDGMECCHNDGNPKNNNLANLRWDTHKNNMQDCLRHGNWPDHKGEKHSLSKLTEKDVINIRKTYKKGKTTQKSLGEKYGVDHSCISLIIRRINWPHI